MDPMAIAGLIQAAGAVAGGIIGATAGKRAKDNMQAKADEVRLEMDSLKSEYMNIDTSNPYMNMQNMYEDLTVNQQSAQFQRDMFRQSQANILDTLRGVNISGAAGVAQALAQQGAIEAQKASADIARQEADIAKLQAGEAARIQDLEISGELQKRQVERDRAATLLGMSQAEYAGYLGGAVQGQAQMMQAVTTGIQGFSSGMGNLAQGLQ